MNKADVAVIIAAIPRALENPPGAFPDDSRQRIDFPLLPGPVKPGQTRSNPVKPSQTSWVWKV